MTTTTIKPHMKQPGELHDKNGRPIYPGDLLKTYHFTGARRKRHYLYHTAVYKDGAMHMVPTSHLQPEEVKGGGSCLLQYGMHDTEIILGYGPGAYLSFEDRPKKVSVTI